MATDKDNKNTCVEEDDEEDDEENLEEDDEEDADNLEEFRDHVFWNGACKHCDPCPFDALNTECTNEKVERARQKVVDAIKKLETCLDDEIRLVREKRK